MCRSIACCAEEDLCNKELSPVYEPTREEETESADLVDPSVYHLALLVSLTICLVLFILLLTFAYLRYWYPNIFYFDIGSTHKQYSFGSGSHFPLSCGSGSYLTCKKLRIRP
jgi:hypothetical protein